MLVHGGNEGVHKRAGVTENDAKERMRWTKMIPVRITKGSS